MIQQKIASALLFSFILHSVIVLILWFGGDITPIKKPQPKVVEVTPISASQIDTNALNQQIDKIKQDKLNKQKAEQQRITNLEKLAVQAEKKRKKEQKRLERLKKQTTQLDKNKIRAEQETKKAKQAQKKASSKLKETEQALQKTEKARKKAQQQALAAKKKRQQEIAERKRKQQEAKELAEQQALLEEQLAAEMKQRQQAHQQQILTELQKYQALIRQQIQQNLIVDDSMRNKQCKINIKLAFNGLVTSVKILSGDPKLCKAAETAVLKVNRFPVSKDPAVFNELKNIILTVEPEL